MNPEESNGFELVRTLPNLHSLGTPSFGFL
jgi:hypothetical protein